MKIETFPKEGMTTLKALKRSVTDMAKIIKEWEGFGGDIKGFVRDLEDAHRSVHANLNEFEESIDNGLD